MECLSLCFNEKSGSPQLKIQTLSKLAPG